MLATKYDVFRGQPRVPVWSPKPDRSSRSAFGEKPAIAQADKATIQAARTGALPKSTLAKACDYTLTLWSRLSRFLEYPEVELSNNLAENDAPGRSWPAQLDTRRKSRGWTTSCRNHSIVETCRRLGLPLRDYLGSVLTGLAIFRAIAALNSRPAQLPYRQGATILDELLSEPGPISCLDTQPNTRGKRIEQKITKRSIISVLSRTG